MSRRALIIATGRYSDPRLSSLSAPAIDAAGLQNVLGDPDRGGFDVAVQVDRPCHELKQEIDAFFSSARRDDLLLMYISGHAVKDMDGELYFAATNTGLDQLLSTGVEAGFIQRVSYRCRAQRMIMIVDTCFSGAFAKGYRYKGDSIADKAVRTEDYFSGSTGRVVITASGEIQYALEGASVSKIAEPSLFTRHVIEGIGTGAADLDGDGQITSDELYRYVLSQMGVATDTEGNSLLRRQRPQRWVFKLDGPDLVVAMNPAPRATPLPAEIVALSQHELPSLRLDAVLRLQVLLGSDSLPQVRAARAGLERLQADPNPAVSAAAARVLEGAAGGVPSRQEGFAPDGPRLPLGAEPGTVVRPELRQPEKTKARARGQGRPAGTISGLRARRWMLLGSLVLLGVAAGVSFFAIRPPAADTVAAGPASRASSDSGQASAASAAQSGSQAAMVSARKSAASRVPTARALGAVQPVQRRTSRSAKTSTPPASVQAAFSGSSPPGPAGPGPAAPAASPVADTPQADTGLSSASAVGTGRIYFYRPKGISLAANAVRPKISLNDEDVGTPAPGTFFYADRKSGEYVVSMSAMTLAGYQTSTVSVTLERGQSLYVRVGLDGWKLTTKLVDARRGMEEIGGLKQSP